MAIPQDVRVAPVSPQGGLTNSQWPTDPGELLGYYRTVLKRLTGLETDLKTLTGDPKLEWDGGTGQLRAIAKLKPAARERVVAMQTEIASVRAEKTDIERAIPGIMQMRATSQAGKSPTQALGDERAAMKNFTTMMPAAPAAKPIGREMVEAEYGPLTDAQWEQFRSKKIGFPGAASSNPMDERAMSLQEQQFAWQQEQARYANPLDAQAMSLREKEFRSQEIRNAQELAMARQQREQQMREYENAMGQQTYENQLGQQRMAAQMAAEMAAQQQQSWAQGMPWAVHGGQQYTPNFEQGGLAQQIAAGIGYNLPAQPIARWDAPDPQSYYQQLGALNNPAMPQFR